MKEKMNPLSSADHRNLPPASYVNNRTLPAAFVTPFLGLLPVDTFKIWISPFPLPIYNGKL